jgi:hypothetical protein
METEKTEKKSQAVPQEDPQAVSCPRRKNCQAVRGPGAFKAAFFAIVGLILILFVFKLGMVVGERKADFSHQWSDNYHTNFAGPQGGFFKDFGDKNFIEANGTFGQIIKIDGSTIVVKGQNDVEKTVIAGEKVQIKRLNEDIKITDLKVDDYIVIIGESNDSGQIEAKFIRIMPPPPEKGSFNGNPNRESNSPS